MKKGFTMIELIFVIVILGILAATAIPKLNATRDDARMVTAAQEADRIFSELGSFYTAQGQFDDPKNFGGKTDMSAMTNVTNPIRLGDKECLTVTGMDQTQFPGAVSVNVGTEGLCEKLWATNAMQQLSKTFYSSNDFNASNSYPSQHTTNGQYKFTPASNKKNAATAYVTFGTTTGINFEN